MDEQERKTLVQATFNAVASGYDNPFLRFFRDSGVIIAGLLECSGREHVLDVATGTGATALAIARQLPHGRVTGVDFAEGMLRQARITADRLRLRNVEFTPMDIETLAYPDAHFDAISATFCIFFLEDMERAFAGIVRTLRPGGRVITAGFYQSAFSPLVDAFFDDIITYGVEPPPLTWKRLGHEDDNVRLFQGAGLDDIRVYRKDLGYFLPNPEAWWEVLWNAGFRGLLNRLTSEDLARFRREHLARIQSHATPDGIRLNVEVLYTLGTRPR